MNEHASVEPSAEQGAAWQSACAAAPEAASADATVAPPGPVTAARAAVVDNNVVLYWAPPATGTLPVDRYEVRKGASWASGAPAGSNGISTFAAVFERLGGHYVYWVAAYDAAGNIGTPVPIGATVPGAKQGAAWQRCTGRAGRTPVFIGIDVHPQGVRILLWRGDKLDAIYRLLDKQKALKSALPQVLDEALAFALQASSSAEAVTR
jgi:hypothetical protein